MTMEQILTKIKQDHGEAVLSNGELLLNLFADYSKGKIKPQQNQLDIFLKCDGNTCILSLHNATSLKQQTEYSRLIQKMVNEYGMQKEYAEAVCKAFWRVAIETEPPLLADRTVSDSKPFSEPEPPYRDIIPSKDDHGSLTEVPPDSGTIPPKPLKAEPRMCWLERITFVLGCGVVCLILYGVTLVWSAEDTSDVTFWSIMLFVALGIVIAMQYAVWKGKIPHLFSFMLDTDGAGSLWFIYLLESIGFATWGIANLLNGWINSLFEITLWIVTPWYYILWNAVGIVAIYREIKSNKRGGKK